MPEHPLPGYPQVTAEVMSSPAFTPERIASVKEISGRLTSDPVLMARLEDMTSRQQEVPVAAIPSDSELHSFGWEEVIPAHASPGQHSGLGKLMTGPDGIVYRLPGSGGPAYPDPDNVTHEPAASPAMTESELISIRNTLCVQLAYLPQFESTSPC